ncbi:hypothetical protein BgiBS90_020075, partial [Biomphalaria glabrata]
MAPKSLLCSCLGLCRECFRAKRKRSRSLIPSGRSRRRKGDGGLRNRSSGGRAEEEQYCVGEEDDEDSDDVDLNSRYSAFDSPLFKKNSVEKQ